MSYEYGIVSMSNLTTYTSNSWEMGYKFTVGSKDIKVSGLRVYFYTVQTQTAHLWKSDGTLIGSAEITSKSGEWVEGNFTSPVNLTAGATYVVSCYNYVGRYNGSASNFVFNSKISYVNAVYGSKNAFPGGSESGNMYPLVDIIIDASTNHKTSGNAILTAAGITATAAASSISWTESKPTGTTLTVSVSTDGTNYSAVTNGGALLSAGTVLDNSTIYIKVEMATTDAIVTPTFSNLSISLQSAEDRYSIVLEMEPLQRFESAAGNITVAYAGGSLMGEGGPVAAFTQTFSPSDLAPKPDQNDQEHIEMSASATGTLTRIYYTNTAAQDMGHIEIASVTATGTLTNVSDL